MHNFTFYSPTRVIFGKDAEMAVAGEIERFGGSRVMIVYGGGSVVRSGLLDKVRDLLSQANIAFTTLGGVQPNPLLSLANAGVAQAIRFGADFILAVGGGSVIDTAKGIAIGAANNKADVWPYWTGESIVSKSLPVGVILTISAAGSETSDSAVLTCDASRQKLGLSTEFNRPRFAILNPELTFTLPRNQIIYGVVDILMHTLDRYFTPVTGNELTDEIAESVLRVTIKNGAIAVQDPVNYQAMSELMWCGSISHNSLTGLGGKADFATHQLGHELSARFDVAHGASLSAVWGSWAEYCYLVQPERFARLGKMIWGLEQGSIEATALAAIEKMVAFFQSIGAPTCFSELGIGIQDETSLRDLTDRCVFYGKRTIGQFMKLAAADVYKIYASANR